MRRVTKLLAAAILGLAFCGSYGIVITLWDRDPPIYYESARALAPSVPQGGSIEVEFRVFRSRICDTLAKRWLTDARGVRHSIPSFTVGLERLAGRETYRRSITIPDAAAVGPARYEVAIDFSCNIIHRLGWPIRLASPPIRFDVTPRPLISLPPLLGPPAQDG